MHQTHSVFCAPKKLSLILHVVNIPGIASWTPWCERVNCVEGIDTAIAQHRKRENLRLANPEGRQVFQLQHHYRTLSTVGTTGTVLQVLLYSRLLPSTVQEYKYWNCTQYVYLLSVAHS